MFGKKEPPATEEHFRKWTQTRTRGELWFVLTRGVLVAVLGGIVGFLVIGVWYEHKRIDAFSDFVIGNGIAWLIGGFFAGTSEWAANEKRYRRELMQFSSANYESPEQTLRGLQPGMTNVDKR
jgi:hypothetical protein